MSTVLLIALAVLTVSLTLYLMQIFLFTGALRRARVQEPAPTPMRPPKVSILKPLAGLDDELRDNLETFAGQQGVRYEVLFGVATMDDPALPVAMDFVAAHPEMDARILLTDPDAGLNPKVAQLIGLEAAATGDVIIVSDSNARVGPHYAQRMVGELSRPGTALVSSVIAGKGERSLGSTLENLLIATFQASGVVGGWELTGGGGLAITIGKSMAMWRDVLERVGGFGDVRNVLAEDQALGKRCQALGYRLGLCFDLIEDRNVHGSIARTLHRHVRWSKTRRSIQTAGYVIEPIILPLPWAVLGFLLMPGWLMGTVLVGVALVQMAGAQAFVHGLRGKTMPLYVWPLEVLRTAVYAGCWVSGWLGKKVRWRGHKLQLGRGAELLPTCEVTRAAAIRVVDAAEGQKVRDVTALAFQPARHAPTTP